MSTTGAELVDFEYDPEFNHYLFSFAAEESDDFWEALEIVKSDIPSNLRSYDPATTTWSVVATAENERVIKQTFTNGYAEVNRVKNEHRFTRSPR